MGRSLNTVLTKSGDGVVIRDDIDDAGRFSADEKCPAISLEVHDDDILVYDLYVDGKHVDSYNSCPGFFDDSDTTPAGGDANALAQAFACLENQKRIDEILRFDSIANIEDDDRYVFATDRLRDLIEALGGDPKGLDD